MVPATVIDVWLPGLFVVHSDAVDPAGELQKLQAHADLPPLMRQGLMEPVILNHCLLLHDVQSPAR